MRHLATAAVAAVALLAAPASLSAQQAAAPGQPATVTVVPPQQPAAVTVVPPEQPPAVTVVPAQPSVQAAPAAPAQPAPPAPPQPATAAAPAPAAPAPVQPKPADVAKAVDCATLTQQFGDTFTALTAPTVKEKLDEAKGKAATGQAVAGRQACMAHDYDAGLDQLRQAIATLGKKAVL